MLNTVKVYSQEIRDLDWLGVHQESACHLESCDMETMINIGWVEGNSIQWNMLPSFSVGHVLLKEW
jgi:hypothetical protein